MADTYDLSAGLFVRGLTNLKTQLTKAEDHATASGIGEAALLDSQLAAQVHWAAEVSDWAVAGAPLALTANVPQTVLSVLDIKTGKELEQFTVDLGADDVYNSAVSPNEKYLAIRANRPAKMELWDIKTGKEIQLGS
jgi:hypothetical protein